MPSKIEWTDETLNPIAVLRPPVEGLTRPTGVVGVIDA
jgi:hypothetical protein